MSARIDGVTRWEFLDDLDVGGEAGAGVGSLEQVVTEQGGAGRAATQRGLERVDLVYALAGVGSLAEHILIHIRNGGGVGIDAAGT